jgi:hypothetical protein
MLGLLMHVNDELAGGRTVIVLLLVFLLPGSVGGGLPLILAATHPPRLGEVVDMWRREHTVFAVVAFIAAIMAFIAYWHRAGDVSQAKIEADCQKAGGMWDSKMNMCMEK